MNIIPASQWTSEAVMVFYQALLEKALTTIPASGAVMVLGPMFILRTPEENFELFTKKIKELESKGLTVFNQIPFTDYFLKDAPFQYEKKFEIFYQGLIKSGKITEVYLLPDWGLSKGTLTEIRYAEEHGIPILYPKV